MAKNPSTMPNNVATGFTPGPSGNSLSARFPVNVQRLFQDQSMKNLEGVAPLDPFAAAATYAIKSRGKPARYNGNRRDRRYARTGRGVNPLATNRGN